MRGICGALAIHEMLPLAAACNQGAEPPRTCNSNNVRSLQQDVPVLRDDQSVGDRGHGQRLGIEDAVGARLAVGVHASHPAAVARGGQHVAGGRARERDSRWWVCESHTLLRQRQVCDDKQVGSMLQRWCHLNQ
jgi:hypothetical protein